MSSFHHQSTYQRFESSLQIFITLLEHDISICAHEKVKKVFEKLFRFEAIPELFKGKLGPLLVYQLLLLKFLWFEYGLVTATECLALQIFIGCSAVGHYIFSATGITLKHPSIYIGN